jgi:hypothetical protein
MRYCTNFLNFIGEYYKRCGRVAQLDLSDSDESFSDQAFHTILLLMATDLTYISISGCSKLTDNSSRSIVKLCPKLAGFNCSDCAGITRETVNIISKGFQSQLVKFIYVKNTITEVQMKSLINNCPNLAHLNFEDCMTNKGGFSDVCSQITSTNLTHLNAGSTNLTDETLCPLVRKSPLLMHIDVSVTDVTDSFLKVVGAFCSFVKYLNSGNCKHITSQGVVFIADGHCTRLESVDLDGCKSLTDDCIIQLATKHRGLTFVNVSHCGPNITNNAIIKLIECCPNLKTIGFLGTDSHDWCAINAFHDCNSVSLILREKDINCCTFARTFESTRSFPFYGLILQFRTAKKFTVRLLKHIVSLSPRLCKLELHGNPKLSDALLKQMLIKHGPLLRTLLIDCCPLLTASECVASINSNCTQITTLELSGMSDLTDNLLSELFRQSTPNFTSLSFCYCAQLSNESISMIATSCANLTGIDLVGVDHLTDISIQFLVQKCKLLRHLDIRLCSKLSNRTLVEISLSCDNLEALFISGCSGISTKDIVRFSNDYKC